MTGITGIGSSSTAVADTSRSAATLASNFDQFLTLLTTQLRNQSPLDPMDANQFTQQLVQFSGVEQQLKTNDLMNRLIATNSVAAATGAVSFIGKTVVVDSAAAPLASGKAEWLLDFPRAASGVTVEVRDARGQVVFTEKRAFAAGEQTYSWNGRTTTGGAAPAGTYQISVKAGEDAANLNVRTSVVGTVDAVDFSGADAKLKLGDLTVTLDSIRTIRR
jgi:flagellar basal-body rod modification protein FlgD